MKTTCTLSAGPAGAESAGASRSTRTTRTSIRGAPECGGVRLAGNGTTRGNRAKGAERRREHDQVRRLREENQQAEVVGSVSSKESLPRLLA